LFVSAVLKRQATRSAESDDVWNGRRSSTTALLLSAADNQRRQRNSFTNVKRSDSLWRVKLVTGKSKEIDRSVF
jgi:hypothetical protein